MLPGLLRVMVCISLTMFSNPERDVLDPQGHELTSMTRWGAHWAWLVLGGIAHATSPQMAFLHK
jgi:hypothetical protein